MPAPRLPGDFDDGLDLLGRAGYPVAVPTDRGRLTLTRWTEDVMSAWLRHAPADRPDGSPLPADAHATLVLDGDEWRLATAADGLPPNPMCGPEGLRFTEDLPDGRSGRLLDAGPARDALAASLEAGLAALNAAFTPARPASRP